MEGYAPFGDLKTWYEVHGDLGFDQVPMLIVHWGAGLHARLSRELRGPRRRGPGGDPV